MRREFVFLVGILGAASVANGALVWTVGLDDNGWPVGDGGGANATFLQEQGTINPLPGSPTSTEVPFGADNDYYFAGDYSTVLPGNSAVYGDYTPLGVVDVNEEGAERAFAAADNDLRYHFNLPTTLLPTDLLSVTFDIFDLDTAGGADPRYGVEVYFNGVLVGPLVTLRPVDFNRDVTTPLFSAASVDARTGPGADNILSLRGTNSNVDGGGNWMALDYVQLDSQPIPEPSSAAIILFAAMGVAPFLRLRA